MLSDIQIAQQTEMLHIRKIAERAGRGGRVSRTVRQLQGQDRPFPLEYIESGRQACAGHRHHPPLRRARARPLRPSASLTPCGASVKTASSPARAVPRSGVRRQGAVRRAAATRRWCPMEDINLHFTGDFHAIGAANNLLAAMLDNHIYQGNALRIDPRRITWKRCVDMNDRQLRFVVDGLRRPRQRHAPRGRLRHHRRQRDHGPCCALPPASPT